LLKSFFKNSAFPVYGLVGLNK